MKPLLANGWTPGSVMLAGACLYVGWGLASFATGIVLKFAGPALQAAMAAATSGAPQ